MIWRVRDLVEYLMNFKAHGGKRSDRVVQNLPTRQLPLNTRQSV
jgi:hypothetical protein